MLYVDYTRYKINYIMAQEAVSEILDEKMVIFQKTQPKSAISESERVDGGTPVNKIEEYVIEMEQKHINERLEMAKALLEDRAELLKQKEDELRQSKDKHDIVYCLKWIDCMRIGDIAKNINYSEPQVYRIIKSISRNLKMIENERK